MKIGQHCQQQRCKHVELEQFLACFRVARVCQRQLGFVVSLMNSLLSPIIHFLSPAILISENSAVYVLILILNSQCHRCLYCPL